MSRKRTFFVQVNIDDMGAEIADLGSTEERGQFFEGFIVGSHGKQSREDWAAPKMSGHMFGLICFQEAELYRAKQAAKARGRWEKDAAAMPRQSHGDTVAMPDTCLSNIQHPTSNIDKPTKNKEQRTKAPKAAAPSEAEWVAYCSETWPDWHPQSSAESWAYYESVGWRTRAGALKDWRSAARTAHSNARDWGKLQPANAPGPLAAPTIEEWMAYGQEVATTSRTRGGATWPKDLGVSAYHQCAANGWKGVTDWKAKLSAECLRWVGMQNGMGR